MNGIGYGNSMFLATHGILARANGGVPPVNTVAPVISGTQVVGSSLSCTTGTWTGDPVPTYTYQWYRGATLISGATSSSYTLVQADAGNTSNITCQVTASNGIGTATATSNTLAQIFDFDANAFITAASITDSTQKSATNTLTIDLKGYSIWTKMKALYPFVGGTASTHKWNLKDPRDLDAAFRLVFSGGWTHSNNGILGNAINSQFDTKLIPSSVQSINSKHFAVYSRTNTTIGTEFNALTGGTSYPGDVLMIRENSLGANTSFYAFNEAFPNSVITTTTDSTGLFISTRTGATAKKLYRNGNIVGTSTSSSNTQPNASVKFGNLAGSYWTNKQYAFGSIGDGLTDTEAANLYTAVQAFNTTLSRQV